MYVLLVFVFRFDYSIPKRNLKSFAALQRNFAMQAFCTRKWIEFFIFAGKIGKGNKWLIIKKLRPH